MVNAGDISELPDPYAVRLVPMLAAALIFYERDEEGRALDNQGYISYNDIWSFYQKEKQKSR